MKISIIIINFKSRNVLKKCLESIDTFLNNNNIEIIIFNNDQKNLALDNSSFALPIKIIDYGKNIGFGKACNKAVKKATGSILLFLNPDTELKNNSLLKMIDFLNTNRNIGAVGPKIIEIKKNRIQPWTCGKKTSLLKILFKNTINKPWNKKDITSVDWLSAAALALRKKDFEEIGGFDKNFFMYFEDQDLCLRLKNLNKKNYFFPKANIYHLNGKSWNNNEKQKKKIYFQSQDYFFQKYYSPLHLFILKKIRFLIF